MTTELRSKENGLSSSRHINLTLEDMSVITSQTPFLIEIAAGHLGPPIPAAKRAYFQQRLRLRIFNFLLEKFVKAQSQGLNKNILAKRIGKTPDVIDRWLGAPSNLTTDTICDLLLGIAGEELELDASSPLEQAAANPRAAFMESSYASLHTVSDNTRSGAPAFPHAVSVVTRKDLDSMPVDARYQPDMSSPHDDRSHDRARSTLPPFCPVTGEPQRTITEPFPDHHLATTPAPRAARRPTSEILADPVAFNASLHAPVYTVSARDIPPDAYLARGALFRIKEAKWRDRLGVVLYLLFLAVLAMAWSRFGVD